MLASVKSIAGYTSAMRWNAVTILLISVALDFRKRLRAGTLKKRFSTRKLHPCWQTVASCDMTLLPSMRSCVPTLSSAMRVFSVTCATDAIDGRASPRNPMVCSEKRSSALRIFDVAWRSKARRASVTDMPIPLSMTCIDAFPASVTSTCILSAPASTAFSTSSLMTDAGRCITSPAAIWLATESGRSCILSIV